MDKNPYKNGIKFAFTEGQCIEFLLIAANNRDAIIKLVEGIWESTWGYYCANGGHEPHKLPTFTPNEYQKDIFRLAAVGNEKARLFLNEAFNRVVYPQKYSSQPLNNYVYE